MSNDESERIIHLLQSDSAQRLQAADRLRVIPPSICNGSRDDTLAALGAILDYCEGLELTDPEDPHDSFSVRFSDSQSVVWPSTYPKAIEANLCDELLYWDLPGGAMGRIYYAEHDGPWHCLCAERFSNFLSEILECGSAKGVVARISRRMPKLQTSIEMGKLLQEETSSDVRDFLNQFPSHYTVHDLRHVPLGSFFKYTVHGDEGIWRMGSLPLWVQWHPKGVKEWLTALLVTKASAPPPTPAGVRRNTVNAVETSRRRRQTGKVAHPPLRSPPSR
jgi:hypothetical protein